jgi:hypothetical protein
MTDLPDYQPDLFEIYGRKMKIEYLGMASVYLIITRYFFGGLPYLSESIIAVLGSFFLFLGLKKKTKDHLSGSLILFASVAVACGPVVTYEWASQYLAFGFSVFVMEGYLEKRQSRIYLLPALFVLWALKDTSWLLGMIFSAMYLTHPWIEKPGLRRRLLFLILLSFAAGSATSIIRYNITEAQGIFPFHDGLVSLDPASMGILILMIVLTLMCLVMFSKELRLPHCLNAIVFCAISWLDGRLAAVFAMPAAVLLSATLFRDSIRYERLRAYFKHTEWYYFWIVFLLAVLIAVNW